MQLIDPNLALAENILFRFFDEHQRSSLDIAFLLHNRVLYWSARPKLETRSPFSPIVVLIQGIYEKFPNEAMRLLRTRIYTSQLEPTAMCIGMIKVAAKRFTTGICPKNHSKVLCDDPVAQVVWVDSLLPTQAAVTREFDDLKPMKDLKTHHEFMEFTMKLALNVPRSHQDLDHPSLSHCCLNDPYENNRPIASLLVTSDPLGGKKTISSIGMNRSTKNRTLHAEVNLIQSYYLMNRKIIPPFSVIYTSLKPCKMCASMIWHCSEDLKSIKVYYANDDLGPFAKDTILSPMTFDRKRATQDPELLHLNLQERFL